MNSRREFLKLLSSYGGLAGLGSLGIPLSAFANDGDALTGYKAIIVVCQRGGNDALNMFVPSGTDAKTGYDNYASIRSSLAVSNNDLSSQLITDNGKLVLSSSTNPYESNGDMGVAYTKGFYRHSNIDGLATNGIMPELAHLVNEGKVAIVANTGTLKAPYPKSELGRTSKKRPPHLFSHTQLRLFYSGSSSDLSRPSGWAGLLGDKFISSANGSIYGVNISVRSLARLSFGVKTGPVYIPWSGPKVYDSVNNTLYRSFLSLPEDELFNQHYMQLRAKSLDFQDEIRTDWDTISPNTTSTNAYGETLFTHSSSETLGGEISPKLLQDLRAVVRLANIGKIKGLKRQIFYVEQGGYDTHSAQTARHPGLLRELSIAIGDLQLALADIGMENEVTTMSLSDFGRSTGHNGDGTDHAWGASQFVLGGAVKGGLYGTLPDLTLGGEEDVESRGRIIPSTAISQHFSTIVKWFGADEAMLDELFPERVNFVEKDLGFME